ncbi:MULTISPECIES: hypothetical protein [unclassified Corallococcus]|uniref:hypothetical protein n=1 Tax=unclassified Corallococcus TaxID=2685029 RepID=UPI001A90964A|nr:MULTISPECIES: hypothetical protein [unclassified Corallococcus]MBN9682686.1 hypothetical protein [Corallococcus sp. NCSPR001]WAS85771.1 hypothetical protein O0N60_02080 [Corallococcus sp. NCRR]
MQGLKWFVGALALLALACGEVSETSTPVVRDGEGLLELPLVSTSAGRSYKLVGATFAITGPQNATITDTSAESVSLPLMAGTYTIQMNGEWHVERTDAPGVAVPVTLVSPNPMSFVLGEGETRPVRFLFKVPEDGTATVGIGVDSGGWIAGTIEFESRPTSPGEPWDVFGELSGKSIPFVISYESATVTRSNEYGYKRIEIQTAPVTFQVGGATGAAFQQRIVGALHGRSMSFFLEASDPTGATAGPIVLENIERAIRFEMGPMAVAFGLDADGYPLMHPAPIATAYARFNDANAGSIYGSLTSGTFSPR